MLAWAEVDRVDVAGFEGDAGLAGGGVGAAFDKEGVEAGEVVSLEAGQDLFHLLSGVGLVEGQLGEDAVQQLEPEQELVLVVRLQDCDTDPEELHKQVHLLFLAGLVLDLEALRAPAPGQVGL